MAMQTCQLCGEKSMQHSTQAVEYHYKNQSVTLEQPGEHCSACDESILSASDLKATRQQLATFKAEIDQLLTPDEIKAARKALKLTQQMAARICGGGKNAFSRYESGELLIPRAASNLLTVLKKQKSLLNVVSMEVV